MPITFPSPFRTLHLPLPSLHLSITFFNGIFQRHHPNATSLHYETGTKTNSSELRRVYCRMRPDEDAVRAAEAERERPLPCGMSAEFSAALHKAP